VLDRGVFRLQQVNQRRLVQRHALLLGDHGEDFEELFLRRAVDLHLEEDPAQRGLVEDIIGVEVGGEHHQRVEGHLELLA